MIEQAIIFAASKHEGQKRKNGDPYIFHPLKVSAFMMEHGYGEKYQVAAVLHDVLEDTDATKEDILSFGSDVSEAVLALTKTKDVDMDTYIGRILQNDIAAPVKAADKIANLQELVSADRLFAARYIKSAERYYYGKFSPALDRTIATMKRELQRTNHDDFIPAGFTTDEVRTYGEWEKLQKEVLKNMDLSVEPPQAEQDARYFWRDVSDDYYRMTPDGSSSILTKLGWVDCKNPFWEFENELVEVKDMNKIIHELEEKDFFYDYER